MRSHVLAAAAALALSACVVHNDRDRGHTLAPGNITLLWDFAGASCAAAPEVNWVHVQIQNGAGGYEALENDGYFACQTAGADGITLQDFAGGSYTVTVDGVDGSNYVLYSARGTVVVDGSVEVPISLAAIATQGVVNLYWDFGPNGSGGYKGCAEAGIVDATAVSKVIAYLDDRAPETLECSLPSGGTFVEGTSISLDPGVHTLQLQGIIVRGGAQQIWYGKPLTLTVQAGVTQNLAVTLDPVATAATFKPNPSPICNPEDALTFVLMDSNGTVRSGSPSVAEQCSSAGFFVDYIPLSQLNASLQWESLSYTATVKQYERFYELWAAPVKTWQGSALVPTRGLADQQITLY